MSAAAPAITKHTLESNLIEKCWKDPEFRREVLKDPKGMLEAFLGKTLPTNLQVIIHEEDEKTLHFAIPPPPTNATELSDEELERVAGGTEFFIAFMVMAGISLASAAVTIAGSIAKEAGSGW
jgi:Nitrile hydratase, alpha chain